MRSSKKLWVTLSLSLLLTSLAFSQTKKVNIDYEAARKTYGNTIKISPMDSGVTIKDNQIILAPKNEETKYTISGYFNGQIVNKTKKTVIKLDKVFLENTDGQAAIYSEAKVEISSSRGTTNYVVSSGSSDSKTAALQSKKDMKIGGSGILYVVGNLYHAVKADDVKIKGSGELYLQGTSKGSAVNCHNFEVEEEKTFKCYMLNSKNGVKADFAIDISSGNFYLYNLETAFKTDTSKEDSSQPHYIKLAGGVIRTSGVEELYSTEAKGYKLAGARIVEE